MLRGVQQFVTPVDGCPKRLLALGKIPRAPRQQAKSLVDAIFYAPYDLSFSVTRVILRLNPFAYVSMESEMWPNVLHLLKQSGSVNILVNGRMSENNFRRASTIGKPLFKWMIGNFTLLAVQLGRERGIVFTIKDVEVARQASQRAWIERWL